MPDRFPLRNVGLFSGEGSAGKSILLMQLGAAHVLGKDWALTLPEPGPFLYLSAEDEEDELERRLGAIAGHYGASIAELEQDYHIISRFGQDAVLAYPDRHGQIRPTPLFDELKQAAHDIHPKLIGLDTVGRHLRRQRDQPHTSAAIYRPAARAGDRRQQRRADRRAPQPRPASKRHRIVRLDGMAQQRASPRLPHQRENRRRHATAGCASSISRRTTTARSRPA